MEGNERELESETGHHESERDDEHDTRLPGDGGGNAVVVESSGQTVDKRETHQENCRREYGGKYIFDGGLVALIAVLVESDKGAEGKRGGFETDDEHQKVAARNHQIHAEEGQKNQFVEFSAAHGGELRVGPLDRLDQDDERTDVENVLYGHHHRRGDIHSCESRLRSLDHRAETPSDEDDHENRGDHRDSLCRARAAECVIEED